MKIRPCSTTNWSFFSATFQMIISFACVVFCTASKKEELSLKRFSKEIAERDGIIQGLKSELEERNNEIEDLAKQLENEMETKRGLF